MPLLGLDFLAFTFGRASTTFDPICDAQPAQIQRVRFSWLAAAPAWLGELLAHFSKHAVAS